MTLYLRPDADSLDGAWTNESGNNTNLFWSLDEPTALDTDYIQSPVDPSNEVCRFALSNPPGAVQEPFTVSYRFNNLGGATLTVRLLQGTTEIAAWEETGSGWTTQDRTLTGPQFAAISDFTNLFVEFTATSAGGDATLVLDLDFTTGTLDSSVTFTRAAAATYINSSGVLSSAAVDVPRFDYDPLTPFAARGLLIEEQRTNILLRSADLADLSVWGNPGFINGSASASRVANSGVAPDGTTTAALCTMNRSDISSWAQVAVQNFTGTAAVYGASIWLKAFDASYVGKTVSIMTYDGAIGSSPITNVVLTANWVRYALTDTLGGSCQFIIGYPDDTQSWEGPTRNGQTGEVKFYAWGAQVELGDSVTSYIPTLGSTVTRSADSALITGTNFSSWYNASAGTFVAAFDGPAIGTRPIISADNNSTAEVIMLYGSGTDPKANITDGGASQTVPDLDAGTITAGTAYKLGLSFAANDFATCLNGGTVATDTGGTLPTPTQLRIGSGAAGNYLNGHLASLKFYNVAKTDAELQALTA